MTGHPDPHQRPRVAGQRHVQPGEDEEKHGLHDKAPLQEGVQQREGGLARPCPVGEPGQYRGGREQSGTRPRRRPPHRLEPGGAVARSVAGTAAVRDLWHQDADGASRDDGEGHGDDGARQDDPCAGDRGQMTPYRLGHQQREQRPPRRDVQRLQPHHRQLTFPEPRVGEGEVVRCAVAVRICGRHPGALVRVPRAVSQEPQQRDAGGRQQGPSRQPAAGRAEPRQAAREPALTGAAGGGFGALPGQQVEARGRHGKDHRAGQAEGEQPQQGLEDAAAPDGLIRQARLGPARHVDQGERQQEQPQRPGRRARGEASPRVRLAMAAVRHVRAVVRREPAAVEARHAVTGHQPRVRVLQHHLGRRARDAVDA